MQYFIVALPEDESRPVTREELRAWLQHCLEPETGPGCLVLLPEQLPAQSSSPPRKAYLAGPWACPIPEEDEALRGFPGVGVTSLKNLS